MTTTIHVVAAAIFDPEGRVLLSRRPQGVHQGGLWEFPGGKLKPGESLDLALRREISEELGLDVRAHRPLIRVFHSYTDRRILLDVRRVTAFSGIPEGREGQPLAWCAIRDLLQYPMPAADRPVISALRLPDAYVITGPYTAGADSFLERAEQVLRSGHRLMQFRAPGMDQGEYRSLAGRLVDINRRYGGILLLNAPVDRLHGCDAHGIHLSSRQLMAAERRPLPQDRWVAASCHSEAELDQARRIGVDFAVLSPVMATPTHPGAQTLGWARFQRMADAAPFPVYALGGMSLGQLERAWAMGGQGIAGIRGLWGD